MSDSIQLEAFLEDKADDGHSLGQTDFTVDRDSALAKLAQYSLPFAGAWLLKAVQAAVASGCREGIEVTASRRQTVFRFDTDRAWTPEEVRLAFLDPDPCADPVLGHFKFALWGAGICGKHPFEVLLPGQWHKLVWDGDELKEELLEQLSRKLVLIVEHRTFGEEKPGFFAQLRLAAKINAENSTALANKAYTCPVPLTLDGRRLDSLFLAPDYFYTNLSLPVALGFLHQGGPAWGVPQGTFQPYRKRARDGKSGLLRDHIEDTAEAAERVETASVAFLYVAHFGQKNVGKSLSWLSTTSKSNLHWVKDGVIVRHETFAMEPTMLSVTCYISAEGLATDLTTLQLVASETKGQRTADAIRAMSGELLRPRVFEFDGLLAGARRDDRFGGALFILSGLVFIMAVPLSLFAFWAARKQFKEAGGVVQDLVDKVRADYPELQRRWCAAYPTFLPADSAPPPIGPEDAA